MPIVQMPTLSLQALSRRPSQAISAARSDGAHVLLCRLRRAQRGDGLRAGPNAISHAVILLKRLETRQRGGAKVTVHFAHVKAARHAGALEGFRLYGSP